MVEDMEGSMESYCLMGIVWEDEKILETEGDGGCAVMWMCLMKLNWTQKMIKMVNFMFYIYFAPLIVHLVLP